MASINGSLFFSPGEGKTVEAWGVQVTFKVVGEDTDGAWSLIEYVAPPSFPGPPPHWHKEMDESFYVLEGALQVKLGDRTVEATAGSFVFIPRGVIHTFSNEGTAPAKCLIHISPAGFEKYFEEAAELAKTEPNYPPTDMSKLMAIIKQYDVEMPGPPPG